ncbi:MAG: hypothetical protein MAG451_00426 [Anaerolineales bacterium]|nr:hypothetical protein [Anaerolineales bacterium]
MNRRQRWLLLAVLLLALGLRVFRLDGQSLWYDEGTSVALAGRSLTTITRSSAADIHPPFYYYLLHGWTTLFGFSPTAVRALSAFTGTALVVLTWALGRRLFGSAVGLTAAFLAAVSPFQVYYSQETRMYILVAALGALSMLLAIKLGKVDSGKWKMDEGFHFPFSIFHSPFSAFLTWAGYIFVSALVLYTHYFGFAVLLAENLALGLWVLLGWRRRLRFAVRWAGAQIVVALLYSLWLAVTWQQLRAWPAVSEPFSLPFLLRDTLRVFSLGLSIESNAAPAIGAFGLLLLAGIVGGAIRNSQFTIHNSQFETRNAKRLPGLMAVLYLVVPLAAMYVLSLRRPLYNPKFLLLATPPFHLLVALGIHHVSSAVLRLSKVLTRYVFCHSQFTIHNSQFIIPTTVITLLLILLVPSLYSLQNYYFDPRFARDDYRGIARLIEATGEPDDAVLLNAPSQIEIFDYYYDGALPEYPLPRERPPDAEKARAELQQILEQYDRIYGIFWATDESDPEGVVERWLNNHAYKAMDAWYGNVRLVLYDVPPAADEGMTYDIGAQLGDEIELQSATLVNRTVEAGDVLPLALRWQANADIAERYKVFVQLLSPANQLIAHRDAEPGGGARLTTIWEPGETVIDRYGMWVPPGTPPANYRLIAGMYHLETGQRLAVTRGGEPAGDFVDLGAVTVVAPETPPPIEALNLSRRAEQKYGPVELLGYTLDKRGAEGQSDAPLYPGDTLRIMLFWQAVTSPDFNPVLGLSLVRGDRTHSQIEVTPTGGLYPASRWSAGDIIRDAHDVPLPADLAPGSYQVRLKVFQSTGQSLGPVLTISLDLQQK